MKCVVTQLPTRVLGLGVHFWGLYLYWLSLRLWTPVFCLFLLLQVLCVYVQKVSRAVLTAAFSVALMAQVCGIYVFLQGVAWSAQLAGSWVALYTWLFCVLLDTLRHSPLIPLCEKGARWLVQAGVWASRGLAQVWGMATFIQMCAHGLFLGTYLCMHVCFAAVSSQVRVRVHVPLRISLPVRVQVPLNLGIKVRLEGQRNESANQVPEALQGEAREEQKPHISRSLEPTRRREVSRSRRELSPGE
jgi:hypothetical protein